MPTCAYALVTVTEILYVFWMLLQSQCSQLADYALINCYMFMCIVFHVNIDNL